MNEHFAHRTVSGALAVPTECHAIIRRRYSKSFCCLLIFSCPQPGRRIRSRPPLKSGGAMTFYDPTLYGRDEEEEFGDSGAYSESLEEDYEEEEEEEEEPGMAEPESAEAEPEPVSAPPAPSKPAAPAGGGGGGAKKKKAAKKKPAAKKKAKP